MVLGQREESLSLCMVHFFFVLNSRCKVSFLNTTFSVDSAVSEPYLSSFTFTKQGRLGGGALNKGKL